MIWLLFHIEAATSKSIKNAVLYSERNTENQIFSKLLEKF